MTTLNTPPFTGMALLDTWEQVITFNRLIGNDEEIVHAYLMSALTEYHEFILAFDPEARLDALCDISVFLLGAAGFISNHLYGTAVLPSNVNTYRTEALDTETFMHLLGHELHHLITIEEHGNSPVMDKHAGVSLELLTSIFYVIQMIGNYLATNAVLKHYGGWIRCMDTVIQSLYSRFCKNEDEVKETRAYWAEKGIETAVCGDFPHRSVISAKDQLDAPTGKLLKNPRYHAPVFLLVGSTDEEPAYPIG